jgi:hypothetical protein
MRRCGLWRKCSPSPRRLSFWPPKSLCFATLYATSRQFVVN